MVIKVVFNTSQKTSKQNPSHYSQKKTYLLNTCWTATITKEIKSKKKKSCFLPFGFWKIQVGQERVKKELRVWFLFLINLGKILPCKSKWNVLIWNERCIAKNVTMQLRSLEGKCKVDCLHLRNIDCLGLWALSWPTSHKHCRDRPATSQVLKVATNLN